MQCVGYLSTSFTMDWSSCLAAHWKVFRYKLLLGFASFLQTFLKLDNVLKSEGVRKEALTWDLQKKQLCVLDSSGFLTTAPGNGPDWKHRRTQFAGKGLFKSTVKFDLQWPRCQSEGLPAALSPSYRQAYSELCPLGLSLVIKLSSPGSTALVETAFSWGWLEILKLHGWAE